MKHLVPFQLRSGWNRTRPRCSGPSSAVAPIEFTKKNSPKERRRQLRLASGSAIGVQSAAVCAAPALARATVPPLRSTGRRRKGREFALKSAAQLLDELPPKGQTGTNWAVGTAVLTGADQARYFRKLTELRLNGSGRRLVAGGGHNRP